jgi:hypothetical protein
MEKTMTDLRSSNLGSAEYEPETQEMIITFKSGSSYAYSGVDQVTFDDLLTASSPGVYFNKWIKGRYPERKLS